MIPNQIVPTQKVLNPKENTPSSNETPGYGLAQVKRAVPRTKFEAEIKITAASINKTITVKTRDISTEGLGIIIPASEYSPILKQVTLTIELGERVVQGKIIWTKPSSEHFLAGILFNKSDISGIFNKIKVEKIITELNKPKE